MTKGQNVLTKFQDTALYDDFTSNVYNFPQKYNAFELLIIENGKYRIHRLSEKENSISYAKSEKPFSAFEVQANITLIKSKNKLASGGLVIHGQTARHGAIIVEINSKKRFKISKVFDQQSRYLSGLPKERGWVKSKAINKKGNNLISVKTKDGYYDVYINGKFVFSAFDNQFSKGKTGFYVASSSEITADDILILKERDQYDIAKDPGQRGNSGKFSDPSFQQVMELFKSKIDKQQATIKTLQQDVDKCRSMLNYDTSLVSRTEELEQMNIFLRSKLDSTSTQLRSANKRLVYLESLKQDIEKGSNGDLVLNLTTILAELKTDNQKLQNEVDVLNIKNAEYKKDTEVLLREIDRLRYLLDIKE